VCAVDWFWKITCQKRDEKEEEEKTKRLKKDGEGTHDSEGRHPFVFREEPLLVFSIIFCIRLLGKEREESFIPLLCAGGTQ